MTSVLAPQDTAGALLLRYAVWGKYYDWHCGGQTLPMRSHLELFDHAITPEIATQAMPDAVAVMMNPGSSEPLATMALVNGYAPAKPDTTQYQLMRVMQRVGWKHVRVLNLSDFRAPKSKDFVAFLGQHLGQDGHSLFATGRQAELASSLGHCAKVILGWGVNPAFEPWAKKVLHASQNCHIFGLQGNQPWIYKHPLPLAQPAGQRAWVENISQQVLALSSNNLRSIQQG